MTTELKLKSPLPPQDLLLQAMAAKAGLSVLEEIEPISARLIANKAHYKFKGEEIEALRRRLEQAVNA